MSEPQGRLFVQLHRLPSYSGSAEVAGEDVVIRIPLGSEQGARDALKRMVEAMRRG